MLLIYSLQLTVLQEMFTSVGRKITIQFLFTLNAHGQAISKHQKSPKIGIDFDNISRLRFLNFSWKDSVDVYFIFRFSHFSFFYVGRLFQGGGQFTHEIVTLIEHQDIRTWTIVLQASCLNLKSLNNYNKTVE